MAVLGTQVSLLWPHHRKRVSSLGINGLPCHHTTLKTGPNMCSLSLSCSIAHGNNSKLGLKDLILRHARECTIRRSPFCIVCFPLKNPLSQVAWPEISGNSCLSWHHQVFEPRDLHVNAHQRANSAIDEVYAVPGHGLNLRGVSRLKMSKNQLPDLLFSRFSQRMAAIGTMERRLQRRGNSQR